MNRVAFLILCVIVLAAVAVMVLAGTAPNVIQQNDPVTIDNAVRGIYANIPTMTAQVVSIASPNGSKGVRLTHDYGSASAYVSFVGFIQSEGAGKYEIRVQNIDGDSVFITRTNTGTSSYNLVTFPIGVWGK